MHSIKYFLFLITVLSICSEAESQKRNLVLSDLSNQVNISSLQINPQGTHAIFISSQSNLQSNNTTRKLVLMEIAGTNQIIIGDTIKGISSPAWMNDGKRISMIANTPKGRQVLLLNTESGQTSVLTESHTGVVRFSWNPGNTILAYFEKEESADVSTSIKYNDSFEVGNNDYLVDEIPANTMVRLKKFNEETASRITPSGFTVATGLTTSSLSWSPDGEKLAFTKFPTSFSGDSDLGTNYLYSLTTGELTSVDESKLGASSPSFTPANNLIYSYPRDGVAANMDDWYLYDFNKKATSDLTIGLDRTIYSFNWLTADRALAIGVDSGGSSVWKLENGKFVKIPMGALTNISGLAVAGNGSMVFVGSNTTSPPEVYFKKNEKDQPVKLTALNQWTEDVKLGKQEVVTWVSNAGLQPNGVVTYPPDFDPTKKYPLVLVIHGGPTASSTPGFSIQVQAMAAKGWIVFQPNYRGSNNLGNNFQSAISKDPSEGPGHDVITGVKMLKEKPYINKEKVAVTGWSYGGWMTSWLIGRYPDEWSAAVAGAAPVDFTDMYSLNDLNRMRRHAIVESPYVGDNLLWAYENSPIYHFSKIKAPTLIMSKTADTRVTITGSYKLYGALRDNNIPVQFVAYPGQGHFPADPVRSLDVWERWVGWVEDHFGNEIQEVQIERK